MFKSKKVNIKVVDNSSAYTIINRKRHNALMRSGSYVIGSSINASKTLTLEETEAYMPYIVNIKADSPSFSSAVNTYWSSINVPIPSNEIGKELEIGFRYKDEETAKKGEAATEQTKYKFGTPINIEDYVLYRYCLVYGRVANTFDDRYKSNNILFYIEDKELQLRQKKEQQKLENDALANYLELLKDKQKTKYVAFMLGIPVEISDIYSLQTLIKEEMFNSPSKFMSIVSDKLLTEKCVIKASLNNPKAPISQPSYSSVIIYNNDTLANSIDDLALAFNSKKHEQLYNELLTLTKE